MKSDRPSDLAVPGWMVGKAKEGATTRAKKEELDLHNQDIRSTEDAVSLSVGGHRNKDKADHLTTTTALCGWRLLRLCLCPLGMSRRTAWSRSQLYYYSVWATICIYLPRNSADDNSEEHQPGANDDVDWIIPMDRGDSRPDAAQGTICREYSINWGL